MPSLREQQQRFAAALLAPPGAGPHVALKPGTDATQCIAIYRNNVLSNYRSALAASYPVVCRLVGEPFFEAAVDAFVRARPSTAGDLNVYGDDFADFLAGYPYAKDLPYLPDVARMEWAIDEVQRAPDRETSPRRLLEALAAVPAQRVSDVVLQLDPACRLVASPFPLLHIWRVNQIDHVGDDRVDLGEGSDRLLVRRDEGAVAIERLDAGTYAWLAALATNASLGAAFDAALLADSTFDLSGALRTHVHAGTIARIDTRVVR